MRREFLRIIAETFIAKTDKDLRNHCFVFPNRRSSIFFLRYLGKSVNKPLFSPDTIAINDLFSSLSEKKNANKLLLLSELYKSYFSVTQSYRQPFDDFIFWGDMLLNDFDDIDKYRISAKDLFTNIVDLREISRYFDYLTEAQRRAIESFWGTVIGKSGAAEAGFIDLWKNLYDIYLSFRTALEAEGMGYEGMIYRDVADNISKGNTKNIDFALDKYDKVVFVGMNALNECEKQLFDYLKTTGKGDFYWDYYGAVIKDADNKSSLFMKDNIIKYPSRYRLPENGGLPDKVPHIEAIAFPSAIGQAKYVNTLLKKIVEKSGTDDLFFTAIVLPDETMLFPLLNSIPEKIEKVNVTMGYTLSQSGVSSFISLISELFSKKKITDGKVSFYFRNVLDFLSHPYLKKGVDNSLLEECKKEIIEKNNIYIPSDFFAEKESKSGLLNTLFNSFDKSLPDYLKSVLERFSVCADRVEKEFFLGYYKCINQLKGLNMELKESTYFTLLRRLASGISIPFRGEPLAGLQIMGPLETRALDFENIIILSFNEGVFPSLNTAPTMIPYNLRKGFHLPTYEYRDAISAYHFYRSIARAKNVYLLYDSRADGLKSGEESRYVKQLEYHHGIKIERKTILYPLKPEIVTATTIPKQPHIEKMKSIVYSPSAINTYMRCPVQFYYQYIEGLEDEEDLTEDIDFAIFGNIYHKTMELLYEDFRGEEITGEKLKKIGEKAIDNAVTAAFKNIVNVEEISGKNLIIKAMIKEYVTATLKYDTAQSSHSPFTYLRSEGKYLSDLTVDDALKLKIRGTIDRIDLCRGNFRIVDYKTGKNRDDFKGDFEKMFDRENFDKSENLFQLYFYLVILKQKGVLKNVNGTTLSLYYVRKLFDGVSSDFFVTEDDYKEFLSRLKDLFKNRILNPEEGFTMCEDDRNCQYCPFKMICNR